MAEQTERTSPPDRMPSSLRAPRPRSATLRPAELVETPTIVAGVRTHSTFGPSPREDGEMTTHTNTFLGREPVLWTALVRAILPTAVLFGLDVTAEQIAGIVLTTEAALALITRSQVTANANVVERAAHGYVIAGPANELARPGSAVRRLDDNDQAEQLDDGQLDDGLDETGRGRRE